MERTIVVLVSLLITTSLYFLSHLVLHEQDKLSPTSIPRFIIFIIIHIYLLCMVTCFLFFQETYEIAKLIFYITLLPATMITAVQIYNYLKFSGTPFEELRVMQSLQMGYLNCYFLIYMYTLLGTFLSGLFLFLTKLFTYIEAKRLAIAMERCIKQIQYKQDLKDIDCAICLFEFSNRPDCIIFEINCGHVFHKQCLIEWLKINHSCPNCRHDIFNELQFEQRPDFNEEMIE